MTQLIQSMFGDMDMNNTDTGGMKMYFYYTTNIDAILWELWKAETTGEFIGALAAVFGMAFFNQLVYFFMNQANATKLPTFVLAMLQPIAYAVHMCIGYFLMLIVMTYNFWLFLAMVIGSTLGYLLFSIVVGEILLARTKPHKHHVQYVANTEEDGLLFNHGETHKRHKDHLFS